MENEPEGIDEFLKPSPGAPPAPVAEKDRRGVGNFIARGVDDLTGMGPAQGDEIRSTVSPLDFIPYEGMARAAAGAMTSAPVKRFMADEAGAIKFGKPTLPMDQASRMARAKEMGFDTSKDLFHGTHADIDRFKMGLEKTAPMFGKGVYVTPMERMAGEYTNANKPGGNILPLYSKIKNPFDLDEPASSKVKALLNKRFPIKSAKEYFSKATTNNDLFHYMRGNLRAWEQTQMLQDAGHDALWSNRDKVLNIFEPEDVRSRFAEFDPAKKGKAGLSYSEGGAVEEPEGLDQFISTTAPQQAPVHRSPSSPSEPAGLDEFIAPELNEEKYGGLGQQAIAGLEGAAQGATFGLSTGLETGLGLTTPEAIRGRREANPVTHAVGQVAGLVGSSLAIPGAGAAGVLEKVGAGAAELTGLGKVGAGLVSQIGADTVKGAFEAALFQGGDEVSKAFEKDPNQTAETAIADMGLAAVLGGVFSGSVSALLRKTGVIKPAMIDAPGGPLPGDGSIPPFISEADRPALEAGDFRASIENSDIISPKEKVGILEGLKVEKPNAGEIREAAQRLGAPVMEGMTSDSKLVQKAEDSLINGAPTYSGLKRQALYEEGYKKAASAVDQALGPGSEYTQAQLGNVLKTSITDQIKEAATPISQLYDEIKVYHEIIPLSERSAPAIARHIGDLKELKLSPSSPEGQIAARVIREIENLKTVDDVKTYKSILNRSLSPTASSGEKRMVGILSDKLTDLEENSIIRFAKTQMKSPEAKQKVMALLEKREIANKQYAEFIGRVQELSKQLGKGRVYGAQDALNFIENLTPEKVTEKLFAKKNSEFMTFFSKEFPEQMALMRDYQKCVLREAATKGEALSPKVLFNQLNKMEPEIRGFIFSEAELGKIGDAETYLRAFPPNFNPSGTSGMSAFREFFKSPTGATIANARDFAIEKFIKHVAGAPQVENTSKMAAATIKGWNASNNVIKAVFRPEKFVMPASLVASVSGREKLDEMVQEHLNNPQKIFTINDDNPVAAYGEAFASTATRAIQYLESIKPQPKKQGILDPEILPSKAEIADYNRALDIAQNPLAIMKHVKHGSVTPKDIMAIQAIYPALYTSLSDRLTHAMINHVSKGGKIPYQTRLGLSAFLNQPLDSTMTSQAIIAAQPKAPPLPQPGIQGGSHSMSKLGKTNASYQMPGDARAKSRSMRQ